ncbi:MAG: aminoglycoside phosphotransferase family protein [Bacilli bacterium]|nr:aminoglycoside phosphotransferase family protein [Bacilli bacterium]MDD4734253.1 aminoglycoside phosphotransferase family protein [Bacilli bacterium]
MIMITESSKTFGDFTIEKELSDGGSPVRKYLLSKELKQYLLRLYNPKFVSSRMVAYENIKTLYENSINVPKPIEFGLCNNKEYAYMILGWINGISIEELIKNSSEDKVMQLGVNTGQELNHLHSINTNINSSLLLEYKDKIAKKKAKFLSLGLLNEKVSSLFAYLEQSKILSKNNASSIIHGDIHAGNVILTNDEKQIFIDLDVCKNGASWYDLASNSCLLNNDLYYVGLIDGYFNKNVPEDFWKVYNFYGCLYCLDYVLYSIRTNGLGLSHGLEVLNKFIDTTKGLDNSTPKWYEDNKLKYVKTLRGKNV